MMNIQLGSFLESNSLILVILVQTECHILFYILMKFSAHYLSVLMKQRKPMLRKTSQSFVFNFHLSKLENFPMLRRTFVRCFLAVDIHPLFNAHRLRNSNQIC